MNTWRSGMLCKKVEGYHGEHRKQEMLELFVQTLAEV
jgi:hypothetical protein